MSAATRINIIYHDGGGGHRNAAVALETILAQQDRPWQVKLVHFQELTAQLDVLRRVTGVGIQEHYNFLLRNGWTLGSEYLLRLLQTNIRILHRPLLRLLEQFWQANPADLLVSVISLFNRQICQSWVNTYPGRPFVTLITDMADFPPRFWIERMPEQYVIAGTARAAEQARALGHDEAHVLRTSGMILRPDFYRQDNSDPLELRRDLGLRRDMPIALMLFGAYGSKAMYDITSRLDAARVQVQLILVCGRNESLAAKLRSREWSIPVIVIGFAKDVPRLMSAADFLIGKPGPGSIAEAMVRNLPVLVECNAWTMPQERYNTQWVQEQRVGIVLKSFRNVVDGVRQMLEPGTLAELKKNIATLDNRAVFEIPAILTQLLNRNVQTDLVVSGT